MYLWHKTMKTIVQMDIIFRCYADVLFLLTCCVFVVGYRNDNDLRSLHQPKLDAHFQCQRILMMLADAFGQ